jgi:colanic acid biosynthesis glycosyl transferase WcaI
VRLLVICPHFAPDVAPTGDVMTRIVTELAARGHELHVVTSLPWYRHHDIEEAWTGKLIRRETVEWGRITRVHPFPTADKRNLLRRALGFGGFTSLVTVVAAIGKRVDCVIAMSPPLTLGPAGWIVSLARRAPFVLNIQDVYPDVAIEVGAIRGQRTIKVLRWLERFSYARADAVTVLSDDLAKNLGLKVKDQSKIRVIPNFVDTQWISPGPRINAYRSELGLEDQVVVMYAGNIGYSQPLWVMVEAARRLSGRKDLHFVVNGSGSGRQEAEDLADGLKNISFVDLQPKERLPEVLAAGDIHVVLLKSGLAASSVPSKTYSVLAAGRPLIASVDVGSEVANLVTSTRSGIAVPPEDVDAFVIAVTTLLDDHAARTDAGRAAREAVEAWLSPAVVAEAYESLVEELHQDT